MAIPDPPKAGSPFCALWTGGWNPKTPKINNFFVPEITLRGGYTKVLSIPHFLIFKGKRYEGTFCIFLFEGRPCTGFTIYASPG